MKQIDILLPRRDFSALGCELGVKIHGWLLGRTGDKFSDSMHTSDELRPFSLFTRVQQNNTVLRLSLLHESAAPILETVRSARSIDITGISGSLEVLDRIEKQEVSLEELRSPAPRELRVILATPASYRHNKRPSNLYSLPPLLFPVAQKLRAFMGVDIPNDEIVELCDLVTYASYELRTTEYKLKLGLTRPAFEGELRLRLGGSSEQRDALAFLLRCASYMGVGAKAALGMGGIILLER